VSKVAFRDLSIGNSAFNPAQQTSLLVRSMARHQDNQYSGKDGLLLLLNIVGPGSVLSKVRVDLFSVRARIVFLFSESHASVLGRHLTTRSH
jgi:hypothetical protein